MKTINKPELTSARRLTASEMNNIHFSSRRTVLTPDILVASNEASAPAWDSPLPSPSAGKAADTDIDFG